MESENREGGRKDSLQVEGIPYWQEEQVRNKYCISLLSTPKMDQLVNHSQSQSQGKIVNIILSLFPNWPFKEICGVSEMEREQAAQNVLFWNAAAAAAKLLQSCPTLCDPMDCSLPGSSVYGIFQARVLEWTAIAFSAWDAKGYKFHWRWQ